VGAGLLIQLQGVITAVTEGLQFLHLLKTGFSETRVGQWIAGLIQVAG
jgi:hypothetical protein